MVPQYRFPVVANIPESFRLPGRRVFDSQLPSDVVKRMRRHMQGCSLFTTSAKLHFLGPEWRVLLIVWSLFFEGGFYVSVRLDSQPVRFSGAR